MRKTATEERFVPHMAPGRFAAMHTYLSLWTRELPSGKKKINPPQSKYPKYRVLTQMSTNLNESNLICSLQPLKLSISLLLDYRSQNIRVLAVLNNLPLIETTFSFFSGCLRPPILWRCIYTCLPQGWSYTYSTECPWIHNEAKILGYLKLIFNRFMHFCSWFYALQTTFSGTQSTRFIRFPGHTINRSQPPELWLLVFGDVATHSQMNDAMAAIMSPYRDL